ncbi:MAG: hypothetical protein M1444_00595 [Patescibacteria group bacterium]|nr:hypothetical protein [Patescibacteria group bacterium]
MQSILISSKNKKNALEYALSLSKKNGVWDIDIDVASHEKTVGIEDIRTIQKRLFLKPAKGSLKTVIIEAYEGLTIEAQNSLLKVLEEPPESAIIMVVVLNKNLILPTILSRCKVIEIKEDLQELTEQEISRRLNILKSILKNGVGKKLKLAQDFGKSREEATIWLEQMLIATRKILIDRIIDPSEKERTLSTSECLNILKRFQKTYTIIKTANVNQRFALENLFLSL